MLLLPLSSFAQYCLLGQVTDETGTSIQGAQLCLYQDGELAGLAQSNAKGEYRIGDVPRGSYQVVASCVGYSSDEDSVVIDRDANLNFILMTKSVELDSVVVMGSSSRATSKGHVFYLTKKAKECGNPFVALQEIPLLYSDPVNESVRSADGQSMLILVDGMRVNSGVSPIDPARIKSVEIIDVVSAKYMRQGVKRVVNIKLKDTSLYTYAQLSTRADYPAKSYFAMPTFEIGNSTVSLYGDASISTEHSRQENAYSLVTPGLTKHYAGETQSKGTDYDFSLMGKWRMTAKDYLPHTSRAIQAKRTAAVSLSASRTRRASCATTLPSIALIFFRQRLTISIFSQRMRSWSCMPSIRTTEPTTPTAWKRRPKGWEAQTSSNISVGTTKDH